MLREGGRIVLYATHELSHAAVGPLPEPHTHRLFDRNRLAALLVEAGFHEGSHQHR